MGKRRNVRDLRTVQERGPWEGGAVVAGIGEVDCRDSSGAVDLGHKGDLKDLCC